MSDGGGKRFDDDISDGLWREFENCAQAVTLLYRNPSWRALQTAAASTTQLYKSGLEHQKNAFEKGFFHVVTENIFRLEIFRRSFCGIVGFVLHHFLSHEN